MLSPRLLAVLRDYWKLHRPRPYLFPGRHPDRPISVRTVQMVWGRALTASGLSKHVHTYAAQLRHSPARVRHRPADHPGPARAPQLQHHRPLSPHHHGRAEIDPEPVRRARSPSRRPDPAMTRPRLEVAEVIRSCRDAFLEQYGAGLTPVQSPRPRRPDHLPHLRPGRTCPGVPGVRTSKDLLQLVRQSPLSQVSRGGRRVGWRPRPPTCSRRRTSTSCSRSPALSARLRTTILERSTAC